jgi:hypothetical protein
MHAFHDAQKRLPNSRRICDWITWCAEIWPYIEQDTMLEQWDKRVDYYGQLEQVRTLQVPLYYCPSRRSAGRDVGINISTSGDSDTDSGKNYPGALGDYAVVIGDSRWLHDLPFEKTTGSFVYSGATDTGEGCDRLTDGPGFLVPRFKTSFRIIEDGLTHTLFVGEKHVPIGHLGTEAFEDNSIYNPDYLKSHGRFGGPARPIVSSPLDTNPSTNTNFGSWHSGICHFLVGDGGVRPITVNIDVYTLAWLCNRSDGHVIETF